MKDKFINSTHVEGYLYDYKLEKRVTGSSSKTPGVEYIRGSVDVATDEDKVNIVTVNYTYVASNSTSKYVQENYNNLLNICNGNMFSVMRDGADKASKVRLDSVIGLNEFYSDRTGEAELVSVKRNDGGFIRTTTKLTDPSTKDPKIEKDPRSWFDCDTLITKVTRVDADDERNIPEYVKVSGYIFNFRKEILPVDFVAYYKPAMDYLENLEATEKNPVFTRLKGSQISSVIVRKIEEANAWNEVEVKEVTSSRKEFVITWAAPDTYEWDDKTTLLATEVKEMKAARDLKLAEDKTRFLERKNEKANGANAFAASASSGEYDF